MSGLEFSTDRTWSSGLARPRTPFQVLIVSALLGAHRPIDTNYALCPTRGFLYSALDSQAQTP